MEQHEIDTFIAMAQRQYEDHKDPNYWVAVAMKFAYQKGRSDGELSILEAMDDDDIPF